MSGETLPTEISLFNTFGQLIYHITAFPTNEFIHESLPVKNLASGIYLVKIKMNKKEMTQKLVKR